MKEVFDGKTYYDILEVRQSASQNDILKAYEKTKEAYSPSSPALYTIFTPEEAQQLNSLIDTAFSVLSHPNRRNEYDKTIKKETEVSFTVDKALANNDKAEVPLSDSNVNLGKTPFGTYAVDVSFEEKIKNSDEFDGPFISKIRLYKNINLEQLSERSKISKSYILAVESHDFESLPAKVFVRGFIVQISKLLNLDPVKVTTSFMKIFDEHQK